MPDLLTLDLPVEPYWLEPLPRGVRVRVRPLDTAMIEAARARSLRKVAELVAHVAAVREAGGDVSGLPDLSDPDEVGGVAQALYIAGLAEIGIVDWEGVPGPVTRDAAARLMRHHDIAAAFLSTYLRPVAAASAEGNGSAASSAGTSGAGGVIGTVA